MIVGSMPNVDKMTVLPALLPVFHVSGTDIDLVNKVKYLGLHIDNFLTWRCQIEKGESFSCNRPFEIQQKLCINGNLGGHSSLQCRTSFQLLLLRLGL